MPLVTAPTLTDGVVTLSGHREDDVEAVVEQSRDPLSRRWTKVPDPYGRDDALRFVREAMPGGWASGQEWGFAVEAPDADGTLRYAGTVSLRNEGEGRAEIAYAAHPWARGRGTMQRALELLLAWGFSPVSDGGRELDTVIWWAEVGNWASRRLAWRVGISCDGTVRRWLRNRDGRVDAWVGSLYRDDAREPRTPWLDVPRIEGERVRLRRHRDDDLDRMHEGATDPVTAYWLGRIPQPYDREQARVFLAHRSEGMAAGTDLHWMLADPDTDGLLGTVSLMHAVIDVEDGGLGLHRVYATAAVDNVASRRVLEAAGFTLIGTERRSVLVRDGMHDGAAYELLAEDFRP
jgi:RimJ/RimL family protein N-acetyltransferase